MKRKIKNKKPMSIQKSQAAKYPRSQVDGRKNLHGGNNLRKRCFSLEWKSEGMTDDESGDGEGDEGED